MLLPDPIPLLQRQLREYLADGSSVVGELDAVLRTGSGWRPHVLERRLNRAWHILVDPPSSEAWAEGAAQACAANPELRIGVAVRDEVLRFPEEAAEYDGRLSGERVLELCEQLAAEILPFSLNVSGATFGDQVYAGVGEYVWRNDLRLTPGLAWRALESLYARTLAATDSNVKGALLEDTAALLMSQVAGYRVLRQRLRGRNEELDIVVENKNSGGALGRGNLVIVECRHTADPQETQSAMVFAEKLRLRGGFAHLGYYVSINGFSRGFLEHGRGLVRDGLLLVPIDGDRLTRIWRSPAGITREVEDLVTEAIAGAL
jgi:Holliday junction resolvase-like predicted endonuclease